MKEQNKYNIKFIKIGGILYTLGLLYIPISILIENSHSNSSNGGYNGGGSGVYVLAEVILIAAVVLTIMNFLFSKPKPKEKYLRFLPLFILLAFVLLFIMITFSSPISSLILLLGMIFLFIKVLRKKY